MALRAVAFRIRKRPQSIYEAIKRIEEPEFGERPPYLEEYLRKAREEVGEPKFYEKLTGEMKKWREFNIIYPIGNGIFIHAHSPKDPTTGYNRYIVIEPPKPDPRVLAWIEEKLAMMISGEFIPRSSEEKKRMLLYLVDQVLSKGNGAAGRLRLPLPLGRRGGNGGNGSVAPRLGDEEVKYLKYHLVREKVGVGILEPFLRDPYIEDISFSGLGNIFIVHKMFGPMESNLGFKNEEELDAFIIRLGEKIGKPISTARPVVDATLPDGSRINIVFGSDVSLRGSNFTIRRVAKTPISVTQLINWGTFDSRIAAYIWMMLREGMSMFVCGESIARGERVIVRNRRTRVIELVPIEELEDRYKEYEALTLDKELKFTFRPITRFIKHRPRTGVYTIVTESGRRIRVTGDHSLFTIRNFRVEPIPVAMLRPGDSIVVPARIPLGFNKLEYIDLIELLRDEPEADRLLVESRDRLCRHMAYNYKTGYYQAPLRLFIEKCPRVERRRLWIRLKQSQIRVPALIKADTNLAILLGLFLSEGCITGDTIQITNKDNRIIEAARNAIRAVFKVEPYLIKRKTGVKHLEVKSRTLSLVLRKMGLGTNAWNKKIPGFVYGLGEEFARALLGAYLTGDASFGSRQIRFWSRSRELIEGLWLLLLGLGIKARYKVDDRRARGNGVFHTLVITGPDLRRFAELVKPLTSDRQEKMRMYLKRISRRITWTIPPAYNDPRILVKTGDSFIRRRLRHLVYRKGGYSAYLLQQILRDSQVQVEANVSSLLESDIILDRVKTIEREESYEGYVYDISVPGTENFVAGLGGILAHNTASGKTTSLNAVSAFIRPNAKIVTIEDTAEVVLPHPNWTRELTRDTGSPESSVTMFDLLRAALRQRPNYIIVGEIRGAEGNIAFQAMQSVTGETPVLVRRARGKPVLTSIARVVDEYFQGDEEGEAPAGGLETLTLTPLGRVTWAPVTRVLRHVSRDIYEITYAGGRGKVRATGSHSVFVLDLNEAKIVPKPVSSLQRRDFLVAPNKGRRFRCEPQSGYEAYWRDWEEWISRTPGGLEARVVEKLVEIIEHDLGVELEKSVLSTKAPHERVYSNEILRLKPLRWKRGSGWTIYKAEALVRLLSQVAESEVELVPVERVERLEGAEEMVYDFSVPETELFMGGTVPIALHNTGHPVMATFHAANLDRLIQRLTNHPINVPKTNMDSLNLAWFQSAVYVKGFPARRVIEIDEIIGYDPASDAIAAVPVFTWDPVTDRFIFGGRGASYLLEEKIAVMRGLPRSRIVEIYEELEQRRAYLDLLVEKGVFEYPRVFKAIIYADLVGLENAIRNVREGRVSF